MKKRILTFMLAAIMVFDMIVTASAATVTKGLSADTAGKAGTGIVTSPGQIVDLTNLAAGTKAKSITIYIPTGSSVTQSTYTAVED